ncbi:hypothetical protein [Halorientalis litorea]|uniref:hypothetical protein n=1 Tax=Halorientalis litorea TaxID=2931977 RepID=UPI001FF555B2|nr:hypothetical protein [Halorientalis litorea]
MPESTNKGGRIPRVSDEDLLDVFRSTADPVLSTAEVADAVPIKRRGTLNRLQSLEEDGELESKRIGGRNTVWWLGDEESRETPSRDASPSTSGEHPEDERTPVTDASADTPDEEDFFPDLRDEIPGSGEHLEGRVQAVRDIYDYLKENGTGRRSDFEDVVNVEATGYKDFNSFYTNAVTVPGILSKLPGVNSPGEGGHVYIYEP